jgi:type VI protein secretion system component VasK
VAQRFAWLHALHPELAASGGAAPELTAALLAMADLGAELEGGGGEARLVTYQMAARRVPMEADLRDRLFEAPMIAGSEVAEAAAAGAAAAALDDSWSEAYQFFRARLSGRYPFDPASDEDALLEDVDAFFNPSGGLVAPFLEPGDNEDAMSASARSALARTRAISRALFDRGELGVDFELQPELPDKPAEAPPVVEYVLNLLGQTNIYQMGAPPIIRCRWPDRSGALLKVQTRDGTLQLSTDGDWAVFRLFRRAEVQRRASREYILAWPMRAPAGYTIRARYLLTTQADPGLVQDPASFLALRLPARLSR